jgi:arginyl-tRNA synthetase
VITLDVRHAIARAVTAAGYGTGTAASTDPGLRPGGQPGRYAASVAFALAGRGSGAAGRAPVKIAQRLAAALAADNPWIAGAEATGQGYLTITVTPGTLTGLAGRMTAAGLGCARSDALAGITIAAPRPGAWESATTWEQARDALAAELTAALAVAAGATVPTTFVPATTAATTTAAKPAARKGDDRAGSRDRSGEKGTAVAAAVAFAGTDAVRFSLARTAPGQPVSLDPGKIARHVPGNPAYAVRYAHARAASGVRWAAALGTGEAGPQRPLAYPGELALLDVLSWLPERVAIAARRSRPDEFARYLEDVARATLATLTGPGNCRPPGNDRLALAAAARTGLAAGLGLLGVSAPDRL